jgi:hypothetical protein
MLEKGRTAAESLSPAFFTGKNGITSLGDLDKNITAQVCAKVDLMGDAKAGLIKSGTITGKEDPSSIMGMINAASVAGVAAVSGLFKGATGTASSTISDLTKKAGTAISSGMSSIKGLVGEGNFASNLSAKVTGFFKGDSASAAAKMPELPAGVPIDIKKIATDSGVAGPGLKPPSLDSMKSSLSNALSGIKMPSLGSSISGSSGISGALSAAGDKLGSSISGASNSLTGGVSSTGLQKGIMTALSAAVPAKELNALKSLAGAVGVGSPDGLKLPGFGTGKPTDLGGLFEKGKSLLGNPKIPGLPSGKKEIAELTAVAKDVPGSTSTEAPPIFKQSETNKARELTPEETAKLKQTLSEDVAKTKSAYESARSRYGANSSEALDAYDSFKVAQQTLENIA